MIYKISHYIFPVLLCLILKADYNLDYKIILSPDQLKDNYILSSDIKEVSTLARTSISILDLNILLSYFPPSSLECNHDDLLYKLPYTPFRCEENGYTETRELILNDILNSNNPILELKNLIDEFGFMFKVTDHYSNSYKISDQYIEIELLYVESDWQYFFKTKESASDISVWDIGNGMNNYYSHLNGKSHTKYDELYSNKESKFAALVNLITLAINDNQSHGGNSKDAVFNQSFLLPEKYDHLKLLIPISK